VSSTWPCSCPQLKLTCRRNPVTDHRSPATLERDEVPETPKSSWPSPSSSDSFTPSIRVPSEFAAVLDSDDEMSFLPTQLRDYRDIFLGGTGMGSPSNTDQCQSPLSRNFSVGSSDSATESDSGVDDPHVVLPASLSDGSVSSEGQIGTFRLASPNPFTDCLEIDYATSPISIPADLTFSSDSMIFSDDGSLTSLPTPVKRFRDKFRQSDR
jgi:hypothetical protein